MLKLVGVLHTGLGHNGCCHMLDAATCRMLPHAGCCDMQTLTLTHSMQTLTLTHSMQTLTLTHRMLGHTGCCDVPTQTHRSRRQMARSKQKQKTESTWQTEAEDR